MPPTRRKRKAESTPPPSTSVPAAEPPPKVASILEALECTICLDTAASPINSCPNGHIICGLCVDKLKDKKCPSCKKSPLQPNTALELMAKKFDVKLSCPNKGCKAVVPSTGTGMMKDHLTSCYFRDISCTLHPCFEKEIPYSQYIQHLKTIHKCAETTVNYKTNRFTDDFVFAMSSPPYLNLDYACAWPPKLLRWQGQTFIQNQKVWKGVLYVWVTLMGSPDEAKDFQYGIKVWVEGRRETYFSCAKLPVEAFHDHPDSSMPDIGFYLSIRWATLRSLSPGAYDEKFYLKLTVEKTN